MALMVMMLSCLAVDLLSFFIQKDLTDHISSLALLLRLNGGASLSALMWSGYLAECRGDRAIGRMGGGSAISGLAEGFGWDCLLFSFWMNIR